MAVLAVVRVVILAVPMAQKVVDQNPVPDKELQPESLVKQPENYTLAAAVVVMVSQVLLLKAAQAAVATLTKTEQQILVAAVAASGISLPGK